MDNQSELQSEIQSEILKLLTQSNETYLRFFVETSIKMGCTNLQEAYTMWCTNNHKQSCMYVFKRGPNTGLRCTVSVKDNHPYCSKHKKTKEKIHDKETLVIDLENISDEEEDVTEEEPINEEELASVDEWTPDYESEGEDEEF